MQLNNSLDGLQEFRSLNKNDIRIYSCGPTVYEHPHIGNLRSFIVADLLRRVLAGAYPQTTIKHVMNITDVDDKTISKSQQEHPDLPPHEALKKTTAHYTDNFLYDMRSVGNDLGSLELTRATDEQNITAMQSLITRLQKDGFAYINEGGVYFSIEAYQKSGKTYGQLTPISEASTALPRIDNDEYDKRSPHDFVLWKAKKPNEPSWDFNLTGQDIPGRPGWHIECSAMSERFLGKPFDIHTGGVDLKFPHHENEIAQSTAGSDVIYAKYFLHNEHMLVDAKKMSKSLGNVYTLNEVVERGHDPLALRLLFLQAHYRSQINFSWKNLEAAHHRLENLHAFADLRWQQSDSHEPSSPDFGEVKNNILKALSDDLNTPLAFSYISGIVDEITGPPREKQPLEAFLGFLDTIFGLKLLDNTDINDTQKDIMARRGKARGYNNWELADKLRQELAGEGIVVRDTPYGQVWSRLLTSSNNLMQP